MIDRAKKILPNLGDTEKAELTLLVNAVISTMRSYQDQPTAIHKKDWNVAKESLAEVVETFESAGKKHRSGDRDNIQQSYKTRAEAFAKFIQAGNYPVKRAQFYTDCIEMNMMQQDKTVQLVDLVAYVRKKFEIDPANNRSLGDEERIRNREALEDRKLIAEVEAIERKGRKDDDAWMEVVDHERQMAAFAGLIEEALKQQATLKLSELIYMCGGDVIKSAKFANGFARLFADALTEAVRDSEHELEFDIDESTEITEEKEKVKT